MSFTPTTKQEKFEMLKVMLYLCWSLSLKMWLQMVGSLNQTAMLPLLDLQCLHL